jgi:hypothetical protein
MGFQYKVINTALNSSYIKEELATWDRIVAYFTMQKFTTMIKNFAVRKSLEKPLSLKDNSRIILIVIAGIKVLENTIASKYRDKTSKVIIKYHEGIYGFLPSKGVDTFMKELVKKDEEKIDLK